MRNRYLDLLRAAAVFRVVLYHVTGWSALTVVFPAMSVMFALGGSMMAASLDRAGPFAVEQRLRRLLPSLWLLSAIAVPAMMIGGLAWDWKLLMWFFPLQDPPAGGVWTEALSDLPWLAGTLAVAGGAWIVTHPGPAGSTSTTTPLGNALWSAAFILVVLRCRPAVRPSRLVAVLNARALTVYLWHVPIIVVVTHAGEDAGWPVRGGWGIGWRLAVVLALLALVVLAAGWVEDLAAGRRPALVPRIVGPTRQDGGHDLQPGPGAPHVLRARIRQHAGRVPDLGREHAVPARCRAEQLRGVRG